MSPAWRRGWLPLLAAAFAALFAAAPTPASIPRPAPGAAARSFLTAPEDRGTSPEKIASGVFEDTRPERVRWFVLYLVETQQARWLLAVELTPEVREWLSRDPLGESGGLNLTAFCGNDPVNQVDPLGLEIKELQNAHLLGIIPVPRGYMPYYYGTTFLDDGRAQVENIPSLFYNFLYGGLDAVGWAGQKADDLSIAATGCDTFELYMNAQAAGPWGSASGLIPYTLARGGAALRSAVSWLTRSGRAVSSQADDLVRWWHAVRPPGSTAGFADFSASTVNRFVRKNLPELAPRYAAEFEGGVRLRTFKKGQRAYRSPWPNEHATDPGRWFGTRRTVTRAGTDSMYQIEKWQNPNTRLWTFEFCEDVTVYYGEVRGGTGYQIFIPEDVDLATVLRYVNEGPLR